MPLVISPRADERLGTLGQLYPTPLDGIEGGLGAVPERKLPENVGDVVLYGSLGDVEGPGDLPVRRSGGHEPQDLQLALGEVTPEGGWLRRVSGEASELGDDLRGDLPPEEGLHGGLSLSR